MNLPIHILFLMKIVLNLLSKCLQIKEAFDAKDGPLWHITSIGMFIEKFQAGEWI